MEQSAGRRGDEAGGVREDEAKQPAAAPPTGQPRPIRGPKGGDDPLVVDTPLRSRQQSVNKRGKRVKRREGGGGGAGGGG